MEVFLLLYHFSLSSCLFEVITFPMSLEEANMASKSHPLHQDYQKTLFKDSSAFFLGNIRPPHYRLNVHNLLSSNYVK